MSLSLTYRICSLTATTSARCCSRSSKKAYRFVKGECYKWDLEKLPAWLQKSEEIIQGVGLIAIAIFAICFIVSLMLTILFSQEGGLLGMLYSFIFLLEIIIVPAVCTKAGAKIGKILQA